MFPYSSYTRAGQEAFTPAQLAFFQRQVAAAEGSAMFPGNASFALTGTGQLTSAQMTAQQRTQDVQRQIDALTIRVNDLHRQWQAIVVPPHIKILIDETSYKNLTPVGQVLQLRMRELQDLRTQLAQAQQNEVLLRVPAQGGSPIKTTGRPSTPVTTTSPAASEFPMGDVPVAPAAAPNYLVPAAIAVGAVALLAGGYYLTRPR